MLGPLIPTPLMRIALCVMVCLSLTISAFAQSNEAGISEVFKPVRQGGESAYSFGPSDEIKLRVVTWDNTALAFRNLDVVSGTFVVGTNGRVMLPIIGGVVASGKGAETLAVDIALALKERLGTRELPSVAIETTTFRPVFVLGDVARPGEYAFRPGMRAVHLLALAGGYYRLSDVDGGRLELDTLRVVGNLREIDLNLATLRIRKERLQAEAANNTSFDLPKGVTHPDGTEALNAILAREREIFQTQRESHALEVESLESSRALLEREVLVLEQKLQGVAEQVLVMAEAVGNLESLLSRGLTRSPTLLNSQRALFELEARHLDAENQIFRARQSLKETERALIETVQRKIRENLTQLQSINAEIDQMMSRHETQRGILAVTDQAATLIDETDNDAPSPVFRVAREVGGSFISETVTPDVLLRPLDTLEIRLSENEAPPLN